MSSKPIFVEISSLSDFKYFKRAADSTNTSYLTGDNIIPLAGTPDIYWEQLVYIKDIKKHYTRGVFFDSIDDEQISKETTWSSSKITEKLSGGIDLCEYPDGTTDKVQYVRDTFLADTSNFAGDIKTIRAKKVIAKEELLNNRFTYGGFDVEMRYLESQQRYIFKVNIRGYKSNPDAWYDSAPSCIYLVYVIATWDEAGEWEVGDLVFRRKYSQQILPDNQSYKAPLYIRRLFEDNYNPEDITRKIRSEYRRLTKDIKVGTPNKCTLQNPYIYNGDTSLVCRRSSFRMPILVLNNEGVLQNELGFDFIGPIGGWARGHAHRTLQNATDDVNIEFDNLFLLEKFAWQSVLTAGQDNFWIPGIWNVIQVHMPEIPYIFIKVHDLQTEDGTECFQGEGGGLLAVHIMNIQQDDTIRNIKRRPGAKFKVFIPAYTNQYTGCVIKNTNLTPVTTEQFNINKMVMACGNIITTGAFVCDRCRDEFVQVKKDHLMVNPYTCVRYNDPNKIHRNFVWTEVFDLRQSTQVNRIGYGMVQHDPNMWLPANRIAAVFADRVHFTTYVRIPLRRQNGTTNHGRNNVGYKWTRFMFNKRGNFKCGTPIKLDDGRQFQVVYGNQDFDEDLQIVGQNHTWDQLWQECGTDYRNAIIRYIIEQIFELGGFERDDQEYVHTRIGSLDAQNGIKTKYVDFAVFPNYIHKSNKKSVHSKHEMRGILVRLTLNDIFKMEDTFSGLCRLVDEYVTGEDLISAFNGLFTARIVGDIDSPKNVVTEKL